MASVNFVELAVGPEIETLSSAAFVGAVLIIFMHVSKKKLEAANNPLIPDDKLTGRNFVELVAEFVLRLGDQMMGKHNRKYLPFVGTIFLYLLGMNLLGLIPGFSAPTDGFTFNIGFALIVFVMYNYWGIREVGIINYLKHLCGPIWWLAPFLFLVEVMSHVIRPISLSLRLYGNMTGDHLLLAIFTDLTKFVIPMTFYGLGTFVSFMQAFVFTLLTMLYIGMATQHEEDH